MKNIIRQSFLFGVGFLCTLLFSEVFIRTARISSVSSTEFYNDIGRGRRRNLDYLYFNEGFGIGRFNEFRYIGEAHPPLKPTNTIRVALLGDSFVESFQIFDRGYFGNIADRVLTKSYPKKQFEFLNFGRSGFDIADMYAYQKILVEQFDPDYILYFISKADLVPNNTDMLRPQVFLENDSLIVSNKYASSEIEKFKKTSVFTQNICLFNMLNNCVKKVKKIPLAAVLFDKMYVWFLSERPIIENSISDNTIPNITIRVIESIDSSKVLFVNRDEIELPELFINLCKQNEITYFSLSQTLNLMLESDADPFVWNITGKRGHWNYRAHRAIGDYLAEQIGLLVEE